MSSFQHFVFKAIDHLSVFHWSSWFKAKHDLDYFGVYRWNGCLNSTVLDCWKQCVSADCVISNNIVTWHFDRVKLFLPVPLYLDLQLIWFFIALNLVFLNNDEYIETLGWKSLRRSQVHIGQYGTMTSLCSRAAFYFIFSYILLHLCVDVQWSSSTLR